MIRVAHRASGIEVGLDYFTVKLIHVGAAATSIALFLLRGLWMMRAPDRLQRRWVKVVPHVVDTALLASALWLAWQLSAVGLGDWLAAKIVALLAYVVLGSIALKRGRTRRARIAALVAAVITFGYIVGVALTKSPLLVTVAQPRFHPAARSVGAPRDAPPGRARGGSEPSAWSA